MKIKLSQCTLAYDDAGSGTPILFIHGYPMNRKLWNGQITALAEASRVLTLDLRGHGDSEQTPGPYSMELFADDCKEFLDALGIQKAVICGLSMGGYVCMAFYRKYAARVAGIVLTATRPAADSPAARENREIAINQVTTQGPTPIVEGMAERLLSPYSLANHPEMVEKTRLMMEGISTQTIVADLRALKARRDSTDLLQHITVPVCIIHGEDDRIVPVSEAHEMQKGVRQSRIHVFTHAGHVPNLEQTALFNQTVHQFLSAL